MSDKARAPVVAITLLLAPVLYVLSAIIAIWLDVHAMMPYDKWMVIYEPLFWFKPLGEFILWVTALVP